MNDTAIVQHFRHEAFLFKGVEVSGRVIAAKLDSGEGIVTDGFVGLRLPLTHRLFRQRSIFPPAWTYVDIINGLRMDQKPDKDDNARRLLRTWETTVREAVQTIYWSATVETLTNGLTVRHFVNRHVRAILIQSKFLGLIDEFEAGAHLDYTLAPETETGQGPTLVVWERGQAVAMIKPVTLKQRNSLTVDR